MPEDYVTQARCTEQHGETNRKLDLIYRGLFIDNGNPCHQTRLDRHDRILTAMIWVVGVVIIAVVTELAVVFIGHVH